MKTHRVSNNRNIHHSPLTKFATCAVLVGALASAPLQSVSAQEERCLSFETATRYECGLGGSNPLKSAFDCFSKMFSLHGQVGKRVGTDKVTRLVRNDTEIIRIKSGEFAIKSDVILRVRNIDKAGVELELFESKPEPPNGITLSKNDMVEKRTVFRVNFDGSKTQGSDSVTSLGIEKITAVPERNGMAKLTLHYPRVCY